MNELDIIERIWQYGTNESTTPPWLHDGVAPQHVVNSLVEVKRKNGNIAEKQIKRK
jgi:hypothetical protein